jgi:hypothetical protein
MPGYVSHDPESRTTRPTSTRAPRTSTVPTEKNIPEDVCSRHPGLFATPHYEVGNQERALSVQYNTTSPSTCPPPESRSRPEIGDRFNTSGTPGN